MSENSEAGVPSSPTKTPDTPKAPDVSRTPEASAPRLEILPKKISADVGAEILAAHKKPEPIKITDNPDAKTIHASPDQDPTMLEMLKQADEKGRLSGQQDQNISEQDLIDGFRSEAMDQFVQLYPEKAEAYLSILYPDYERNKNSKNKATAESAVRNDKDPGLKDAFERYIAKETLLEKQTLQKLGYSEQEITQLIDKSLPNLLPHERSTRLVLQSILQSPELHATDPTSKDGGSLGDQLIEVYGGKLLSMIGRHINQDRSPGALIARDQLRLMENDQLLELFPEGSSNPRVMELKTALQEQFTKLQSLDAKAKPNLIDQLHGIFQAGLGEKEPETALERSVAGVVDLAQVVTGKKEAKGDAQVILQGLVEGAQGFADSAAKAQDNVDVGEFSEWMLSGGGWRGGGGGGSGESHGQQAETETGKSEFSAQEIADYTHKDMQAEIGLVLRALSATEMFAGQAQEFATIPPQELIKDQRFMTALEHSLNPANAEFEPFTGAIMGIIREKPTENLTFSGEAIFYLLAIPKRFQQDT